VRATGALMCGILLTLGLAACTPAPQTPEERALDVAERFVSAAKAGSDDSVSALRCAGVDPRLGVNSDTAGFDSYTLDVEEVGDGDFDITVTRSYPDYPDVVSHLRIQTEDDACIEWVK
jgi:hypothetical protein